MGVRKVGRGEGQVPQLCPWPSSSGLGLGFRGPPELKGLHGPAVWPLTLKSLPPLHLLPRASAWSTPPLVNPLSLQELARVGFQASLSRGPPLLPRLGEEPSPLLPGALSLPYHTSFHILRKDWV